MSEQIRPRDAVRVACTTTNNQETALTLLWYVISVSGWHVGFKGGHGSDQFTKLVFESGHKCSVLLDANVSVEVVVTKKYYTTRNFPCTVLQSPVVLITLKAGLVSTTVYTLKARHYSAKLMFWSFNFNHFFIPTDILLLLHHKKGYIRCLLSPVVMETKQNGCQTTCK